MDKRLINGLGVELPMLGFGCMRFPVKDGKIDFEQSKELIHHAMEKGLNYFDTAYNYHSGDSETFLGEVLTDFPRESYYLTSKLPIWNIKTIEDAERIFNEQLSKCKADYFDFYLLHALNKNSIETVENLGLYDFIAKKKEEGKIKFIGFSYHDNNEILEKYSVAHKWDFIQLQINYWDWAENEADEAYKILEKNNIPCFIMEPVRGGFLSSLAPHVQKHLTDYKPDSSVSSWALNWIGSLPNVAIVLSGMSNMEQLQDNINTFSDFKQISEEELKLIDIVVDELRKIKPIPCTGCRYCMDCPFGVNIPKVFEVYNNYKKTENIELTTKDYKFIKEEQRPENCQTCGVCIPKCPQNIDIPEELAKIEKEFSKLLVLK